MGTIGQHGFGHTRTGFFSQLQPVQIETLPQCDIAHHGRTRGPNTPQQPRTPSLPALRHGYLEHQVHHLPVLEPPVMLESSKQLSAHFDSLFAEFERKRRRGRRWEMQMRGSSTSMVRPLLSGWTTSAIGTPVPAPAPLRSQERVVTLVTGDSPGVHRHSSPSVPNNHQHQHQHHSSPSMMTFLPENSSSPPMETEHVDDEECELQQELQHEVQNNSDSGSQELQQQKQQQQNEGTWSKEEHDNFLLGYATAGRNWGKISKEFVKTRSRTQVASHAQKHFKKIDRHKRKHNHFSQYEYSGDNRGGKKQRRRAD